MVSNASKPLDKVSILRLSAAEMRLHLSCLNPKRYKNKPLELPPAIMSSLDLIEKTIGGFIVVTNLAGLIVFCSRSIEDYLGYQNIDVMGNKVVKYIYEDDIKYFEAKVSSVVNSLKKSSKKKTKVIKAHMLQKPLPRSNESCRPRNMIFKISVHQNDLSDTNGGGSSSQTTSALKKTRTQKDYGYAAVVLMFIEPVRLEPEIDITYIDSNQDVYFTRHGLQGEIIYADQRISSITGYMPHDVQGTSAYQYICSSDVPIALFAQKAMFTSNDGKGDIVYRLRIRDMRFIYLQSSGQIAYKESSNEISHFVCFNRLLSEEEGSQELKKFQQRYAPQIMAAKMLQVKQNRACDPTTDMALEQAMAIVNSTAGLDATTAASLNSFQCSKISSPEVESGASEQMLSGDSFVPASVSSTAASSVHSSEGHSMTSPMSIERERSSSITSEYSGYASDRMEYVIQKPEQTSPLRSDCNSFISGAYESAITVSKGKCFSRQNSENGVNSLDDNMLVISKSRYTENTVNINGPYRVQQNGQHAKANPPIMHSVNAFSSLQNSVVVADPSEGTLGDHPMDINFDHAVLQKNSFECSAAASHSNVYADKNIGMAMLATNGPQNEYALYNGQASAKQKHHFISLQNNLQMPIARSKTQTVVRDQQLNFNGEQISQSRLSHRQDLLNLPGMYDISVSSLQKNSVNPLSVVSELNESVEYCPSVSSYQENGNCANSYLPTSISSYNNGANEASAYNNGLDAPNSKPFGAAGPRELNGFHVSVSSVDILASFPEMNSSDAMDTSMEMNASHLSPEKTEYMNSNFPATVGIKSPIAGYENGSSDLYSNMCGPNVAPANWTGTQADPISSGVDLGLNKELYEELDLFFQNLPQSNNAPQNSSVAEQPVSEFSVVDGSGSSYTQNSISSSRAKRNYHQ